MNLSDIWSSVKLTFRGFTDRTIKVINVARDHAIREEHQQVMPEHILVALATVEPGPGRITLKRLGVDLQTDLQVLTNLLESVPHCEIGERPGLSPMTERVLDQARAQGKELGHNYVGTEHLVLGILAAGPSPASNYLFERGITIESFRTEVLRLLGPEFHP